MADSWLRQAGADQTRAVITALLAQALLPNLNLFERHAHDALAPVFTSLIDELPISFALTAL